MLNCYVIQHLVRILFSNFQNRVYNSLITEVTRVRLDGASSTCIDHF